MRWLKWIGLGIPLLTMISCGGVDEHVDPVVITADPSEITRGDSTTLKWAAAGGVKVLDSNFGASNVTDSMVVWPDSTTEYKITIRLATTDIFTAKVTVTVDDPPPPPDEAISRKSTSVPRSANHGVLTHD